MTRACQFLRHSRQSWYQDNARSNKKQSRNLHILDSIARVRCREPRIGTRKLDFLLNSLTDKTLSIGRDRLFALLDEHRLLVPVNGTALGGVLAEAAWRSRPVFYLIGENDLAILPVEQERMATRMNATIQRVASSHVPMLSHPQVVADFILRAASWF